MKKLWLKVSQLSRPVRLTNAQPAYIENKAAGRLCGRGIRRRCGSSSGDEVDIGIDFHGADQPGDGQAADQGWSRTSRCSSRSLPGSRTIDSDGRNRAGHVPAHRYRRARFHEMGLPRGAGEEGRHHSAAGPLPCRRHHRSPADRGMAEAYYATVAPHNPLGPISLAAGVQIAASIPNFLCQEQVTLGEGYIKTPFKVREGYLDLPTGPDLASSWMSLPWPTRSVTIGRIPKRTMPMMVQR